MLKNLLNWKINQWWTDRPEQVSFKRRNTQLEQSSPIDWTNARIERLVFGCGVVVGPPGSSTRRGARHFAYKRQTGQLSGIYQAQFTKQSNDELFDSHTRLMTPLVSAPFEITEQLSTEALQCRRLAIERALSGNLNSSAPPSVMTYLEEAWYYVPVHIALQLQRRRQFVAALDWLRTVYDYSFPEASQRNIYAGLDLDLDRTINIERAAD